ncbi:hypothetical protein HYPSUDRAFT_197663 [Hypholoma sublateritium FD-334 SS-4]|uniref:Uncharacterized protein n=1 Tax=Hypholoma sublateritium (strain FD-334 SS-4) TaxID=945553 RepID=A0A0D2MVY5_HYPSF|nr:hypothetical protein HYPSUDRAFT_197663 [Hypholoma sublateritium FD-334 SS-4]
MAPVPQEELPILEALIKYAFAASAGLTLIPISRSIRNRLTALKKDRGEFIKASDVNQQYQAVVKQITKLNDIRDDNSTYNNRLDTTLADVFSLLSLFYLTIGKTRDAPATYCQIASMRVSAYSYPARRVSCTPVAAVRRQILNHMNESAVYNETDLAPFHRRLTELRSIVQQDGEQAKHPKALTKLLERQLNECDAIVEQLQESLAVISPELMPVHQKLVTVRRQLVALAAKEGSQKAELKPLQEELRRIDSLSTFPTRVDGKFLGAGGVIPSSQAICSSLLEECFEISHEIKANEDSKNVASSLKPIYDRLSEIRFELENLVMTHRWSLRETDLWNYSLSLQEIDKMRVDGKFVDSEGNRPSGQFVLLYLLRRCYGLIYRLLSSSEPVSEELMPVANKLTTVKKCLNEVLKYGGPFNPRDLYPYQLALFQIDSMRKDGRFIGVDGTIPEGQGIINANLSECHELLKESMDEGETEEDDEEDFDYSGSESDEPAKQ